MQAIVGYPRQREDVSYGVFGDYTALGFLLDPTPQRPNALVGYDGFVADTKFSVDRGFFDAPTTTTITCETPGSTIVYTLDGSSPALD